MSVHRQGMEVGCRVARIVPGGKVAGLIMSSSRSAHHFWHLMLMMVVKTMRKSHLVSILYVSRFLWKLFPLNWGGVFQAW